MLLYTGLLFFLTEFCQSASAEDLLSKHRFPDDFLFGVATSAYQIEGGQKGNGYGKNIWDYYMETYPGKFYSPGTAKIACDSFHKFREDVKLIKNLGVQFYRFSVSWGRVLPEGYSHNINKDGLRYYNDLINELLANGIRPMVTMYHGDLPLALHELGGWTNPYMAYYFEDYARVLYSYFGDRVKYWITFNGACIGYGDDGFVPFLNQSGIANYLCNQVLTLAHAKAYHLYDKEFRILQKGKIGIVFSGNWYEPGSFAVDDIEAAERAMQFKVGIYANPIFHPDGDFPKLVRERVHDVSRKEGYLRSRLPEFSREEVEYVQGTYDFLGFNCYTSFLVENVAEDTSEKTSFHKDLRVKTYQDKSWERGKSSWLGIYPEGTRKLLKWVKENYDDPEIIITENGFSDNGELNDVKRIKYYQKYLSAILDSIHEDKVNVKGFAAWSLLDNFEWMEGYSEKFGLYHVDFSDPDRKRTPKKSVQWYKKVVKERRIVELDEISSRLKGDL
ncbi:myrosinase 1-like [Anoplophora glabripennis]|uniref:myrosinase 1-like n=1 Tax=Anoplophora glabripennis TaxID=217634 RepID=UPI00087514F0|nr:myrosinase 1-like [Anoplophora glabripennis]